MTFNLSAGSTFLHGILKINLTINPWHRASGAATHFKVQVKSPNSRLGNRDCVVKTSYVDSGSPTVEITFENGTTNIFDFDYFWDTRALNREIEHIKRQHKLTKLLKDDDWDDMEDTTHASIPDFLKSLQESRDTEADELFEKIHTCRDPQQRAIYRQQELDAILKRKAVLKAKPNRRGYE